MATQQNPSILYFEKITYTLPKGIWISDKIINAVVCDGVRLAKRFR